jgi:hypothetical protein
VNPFAIAGNPGDSRCAARRSGEEEDFLVVSNLRLGGSLLLQVYLFSFSQRRFSILK